MRLGAILILILTTTAHAAVEGEGKDKQVKAARTAKAPVIDGHFEPEIWDQIEADSRFTQNFPDEGGAPTEKTEFKILYDDDKLYVAVRCWDRDPDGVSVRLTRRDRDIETDWLALYIDSRHDHNTALVFQLSAAGVMVDGQMFNDTDYNPDWDAVWYGKVARDKDGWNAEFAIPLSVLRFSDKPIQEWGLQVHRNISRRREWDMWVHTPRGVNGTVSRFGHVTDIVGLEPRRTFELRPYAVTRLRSRAVEGGPILGLETGTDFRPSWDVGADLKLGLTSRLTLDATINPDFGQVEADQVVLNLTRFETFFPEKRPFFLEGREVFETPITMFYPRRIGRPTTSIGIDATVFDASAEDAALLVTDTQAVTPIWTAAKVTGGVGDKLTLGVLGALTGAEEVETVDDEGNRGDFRLAPPRMFGVMRGRYSVGRSSWVGVTATAATRVDGEMYRAAVNHDAYAQAIDGWWQNGPLRLEAQGVVSERIGGTAYRDGAGRPCDDEANCIPIARADGTFMEPGAVGGGALVRANYSTPKYFARALYTSASPKLDLNAVGFQPEFNRHYVELIGGYVNRTPGKIFQFYNIIPVLIGGTTWEGTPTQAIAGFDVEAMTRKFWFTSPQLLFHLPGTWDQYETLDGALFERPAKLDFNWFVETNPSKPVYGNIRVAYKKNFSDEGYSVGAVSQFRWQALSNLELSVDPEIGHDQNAIRFYDCATDTMRPCLVETRRHYTFAELDTTYFSTTFRGTYTLAPELSIQAYAQLFLATGTFTNASTITTDGGRHPEIERDDLTPAAMTVDDGFDEAALNVNLVLRWEPDPGSVLFFVYTRDQQAPSIVIRKLDTGPTEEVVLLKLVYFIS